MSTSLSGTGRNIFLLFHAERFLLCCVWGVSCMYSLFPVFSHHFYRIQTWALTRLFKTLHFFFISSTFVDLLVCFRTCSCVKVQFYLLNRWPDKHFKHSGMTDDSLSVIISCPGPKAAKQAQTMTLPLPCATGDYTSFFWSVVVFGIYQTCLSHLSPKIMVHCLTLFLPSCSLQTAKIFWHTSHTAQIWTVFF